MERIVLSDVPALSGGLSTAQVDVYFFDSDAMSFADTLNETERARCARFATPLLRDRFRVCHAGKRAILSSYLGCPPADIDFVIGTYDKPRIGNAELTFNLSHSANWVAMAIARAEVGVDCERIDPTVNYRELLDAVAHPAEHIGSRDAFYRTWTRKEAVMKQLGLGFQLAPVRVQVPDAAKPLPNWRGSHIDIDGASLRSPERAPLIVDVPAPPGYMAALAASEACAIRVFQLCDEPINEGGRR
jgi:4'-phosphopantetheinyl transferase